MIPCYVIKLCLVVTLFKRPFAAEITYCAFKIELDPIGNIFKSFPHGTYYYIAIITICISLMDYNQINQIILFSIFPATVE